MTNQEFSDTFTTMLNSYNTQAAFGEQASRAEIVLDEYEKSVLLTQAQDIVVKSYFDGTLNQQGQGFDDSSRRQVDFSSLIKVAVLDRALTTEGLLYDTRGIMFKLPLRVVNGTPVEDTTDVLFILNEKLRIGEQSEHIEAYWHYEGIEKPDIESCTIVGPHTSEFIIENYAEFGLEEAPASADALQIVEQKMGWVWYPEITKIGNAKDYIIIPINYKEYDREMSKPYAQPLKKQAWRLFQNGVTGFDINTELIPRWNLIGPETVFQYIVRYVKRPRPIILEDLPDGLVIDGESSQSECELNPIIHMDILNKAVELALVTRGRAPQTENEQRRQ